MKTQQPSIVYHSGDIGDVLAAIPSLRAIGSADLVIGPGFCRESMKGARFDMLRPLLMGQQYVRSVSWTDEKPKVTHDLSVFRETPIRHGESLAHWQARHLQVEITTEPWLKVEASSIAMGRTVFARSPRYHNPFFPWFALIKRHPDALFVGSRPEHEAFQKEFSCKVEYVETPDLLALAELIAGCSHIFCNQSCPFWIAIGLGANVTQETWRHAPNSIIPRANARYAMEPEECQAI